MKNGIISLGEALIDFIPVDQHNTTYLKSPGGAPANVAVGLARLGAPSTFFGKVGDDVLGQFLTNTLKDYGVRTNQMHKTPHVRTGVVFVTNAEDGERSFDFYINPSADQFLEISDLNVKDFISHKILHFGSISMINNPAKDATQHAVELAKKENMLVSYDPNLRIGLWDSAETARTTITSMIQHMDILKISEEELEFITNEKDIFAGIEKLKQYQIPLMVITLGSAGSYVCVSDSFQHVPTMKVTAVDTTGAGDAFVSGLLYCVNNFKRELSSITIEEAIEMARFASVSGALAASKKGAMTALPTIEEVKYHLEKVGN